MSAEEAFSRTWRVGRFRVTLSSPPPRPGETRLACVEWEPYRPSALTEGQMREYRAGRNAAAAELGQFLGGTVAVVEL